LGKLASTSETVCDAAGPLSGPRGAVIRGLVVFGVLGVFVGFIGIVSGCRQEAGPSEVVNADAMFGQMCASCHGPDGKGSPQMVKIMPVKDLTAAETQSQSNEALGRVIEVGRGQMPSFGGALTPRKIQLLVGHIRELGQGAQVP